MLTNLHTANRRYSEMYETNLQLFQSCLSLLKDNKILRGHQIAR